MFIKLTHPCGDAILVNLDNVTDFTTHYKQEKVTTRKENSDGTFADINEWKRVKSGMTLVSYVSVEGDADGNCPVTDTVQETMEEIENLLREDGKMVRDVVYPEIEEEPEIIHKYYVLVNGRTCTLNKDQLMAAIQEGANVELKNKPTT